MARVTVDRTWPDGDHIVVSVTVEGSFPDAVAEARTNARRLYAEVMNVNEQADAAVVEPESDEPCASS